MRVLVAIVEAAGARQPTAMLYEDAHWVDPTSLEALDLLIDRVRTIPLLIVLTPTGRSSSPSGAATATSRR